jgi:hypothetical protein
MMMMMMAAVVVVVVWIREDVIVEDEKNIFRYHFDLNEWKVVVRVELF